MNLKKKIYLYANSTSQRCPKEKRQIFLIEDFFHLPPVLLTPVVHLANISANFRKNGPNAIIRGLGETDPSRKSRGTVPLNYRISTISHVLSWLTSFSQLCRKLSETLGVASLLLFCQQSQTLCHVTFSLMSSCLLPLHSYKKQQIFQLTFVFPPPWHCKNTTKNFSYTSFSTLQRKFHLCTPRKGIVRPQSQFPNSFVCDRFINFQDQSTYFPAAE